MTHRICRTVALILLASAPAAALANVPMYETTYTGVVNSGDFLNDPVTLSFIFSYQPDIFVAGAYDELGPPNANGLPSYGTQFVENNPIENAYFQIGSNKYAILGTDSNALDRQHFEPFGEGDQIDNGTTEFFGMDGENTAAAGVASSNKMFDSGDPRSPFSYTVQPGDTTYGNIWGYGPGAEYSSSFSIASVSERALGALPEPSSWLLMILGFGFVGWTMRGDRGGRQDQRGSAGLAT